MTLPLPIMNARVRAGAIPDWNRRNLVHRPCPACLGDSPICHVVRPDELTVHRCRDCEMLYLADVPSPDEVTAFYARYSGFKHLRPQPRNWLTNWFRRQADPYARILEETGGLKGRRLVDIGCAYGDFLQSARAGGAQTYGVDLDESAVRFVSSLGISMAADVTQFSHPFEIATAFQLLEHLADPNGFLDQIADRMVDDGRLLIAVPNGGDAETVGPGWIGFRVDLEHFNYFTAATMSRLLIRHGFYVERHWEFSQPQVPRHDLHTPTTSFLKQGLRKCGERMFAAIYPESRMCYQGQFVIAVLAHFIPQSACLSMPSLRAA